ncbi:MAG: V-type ATP synthase subunit D [Firmicutes bacterium]|nr:V-type ATP synthase subunit D [Bacillota bacterium]
MELRVSPTRMQLLQLKRRLAMARRGHRLLKDKRDELMRQFMELVGTIRDLRLQVEGGLFKGMKDFLMARTSLSASEIEASVMYPKRTYEFEMVQSSIMGVKVPSFRRDASSGDDGDIYPYGLAMTSAELDAAIDSLDAVMPSLLELAEKEKSAELLAEEIEKTRRRVNALEYVLIPKLEDTIRYITMKLDEAERGNLTRLMKVKEMVRDKEVRA